MKWARPVHTPHRSELFIFQTIPFTFQIFYIFWKLTIIDFSFRIEFKIRSPVILLAQLNILRRHSSDLWTELWVRIIQNVDGVGEW